MGSEMCIRDRVMIGHDDNNGHIFVDLERIGALNVTGATGELRQGCLLYTSDAADERSSVDLGGRRIIKK